MGKVTGRPFQPGHPYRFQPGNPGRPKGTKHKLSGKFLTALMADFEVHGVEVIEAVRANHPADYLKLIASLMPRETEIRRPLEDVGDAELDQMIEHVRNALADEGVGDGEALALNPA